MPLRVCASHKNAPQSAICSTTVVQKRMVPEVHPETHGRHGTGSATQNNLCLHGGSDNFQVCRIKIARRRICIFNTLFIMSAPTPEPAISLASLDAFYAALSVNSGISFACIVAFCLLRPLFLRVYAPRSLRM